MSTSLQKCSLQEGTNGTITEVFYFKDGCKYEKLTIDKLLRSKAADSKTKLNLLVRKIMEDDHEVAFGYLLQKKYKMGVLNSDSQTAVHLTFYNHCCKILFSLGHYLLNTHDNSNYTDTNGLTYLHVACYMDNATVVEKLLSNDMDVNLPLYLDIQGYEADLTLLHFAVTQSSIDVIRLLLENGASVDIVDALGRTPLHLACSIYEFSEKYYKINIEIIKLLLENGSDVNAKDKSNNTPLMSIFPDNYYEFQTFKTMLFFNVSVVVETLEKFQLLVERSVDLNAKNKSGDTILHLVIKNMRHLRCPTDHPIISFADTAHVEMVKLILNGNQKVKVDAKNNSGETPIELAVASMSVEIVKMLLNHGADLSDLKFNHKDPMWFYHPHFIPDLKAIRQIVSIISLLLSHGFKLSFEDNFAVLKFFIHDFDECECGSIHYLPNNCDVKFYLIHLLQYGSPKHIKHVLKKSLRELSTKFDEQIMKSIYVYIGEYLRYIKMGELFIDEEVFQIIKDFHVSHSPIYPLKAIQSEVDHMKFAKLKDNLTLYDIMVDDPKNIYGLIMDSKIFSAMGKFTCYKDIIQGHVAKSLVRLYVANSACDYLQEQVSPSLPRDCCQMIVNFLSNEEILVLYMAIVT